MSLLWNRDQSKHAIEQRIAQARVRRFWHVVWILTAIAGVLSFGYLIVYSFGDIDQLWQLVQSKSIFSLLVWIGLVGSMFVAKDYVDAWRIPPSLFTVLKQQHGEDVELSRYFSKEALHIIDQSFSQHHTWHPLKLFKFIVTTPRAREIVNRLGKDNEEFTKRVKRLSIDAETNHEVSVRLFKNIVYKALEVAYQNSDSEVHVGDLFVAMGLVPSMVRDFLVDNDIQTEQLRGVNSWMHYQRFLRGRKAAASLQLLDRGKSWRNQLWTSTVTPLLDAVGTDVTRIASGLPPLVDRQKEMQELFEIVNTGNFGVLLTGPKGAGKWRFIEGLAQKIITQQVPGILADRRLVTLSIAKLLSLSNPRNPLKTVTAQLAQEINRSSNIIIALDDLADFESAKTDDAASLVESVLNDVIKTGQVLLLATIDDEKMSRASGSLISSLPKLRIDAMSPEITLKVLESQVPWMERQFNEHITYPALNRVVELSSKFFHEQAQPGKSISLLQQVLTHPRASGDTSWITSHRVETVVAEKTGLPVTQLSAQESDVLLNLEALISKRYINQKRAVAAVSGALRRARTELASQKRPIANFLFLGPTGVGKTELARRLATIYFGGEGKMIRLDMSEYQEPASLRNLIGAPPGTGGDTSGHLVEAIRDNPFAVLLLDEFEKAHADVLNVFLQVMEDGRLSSPDGQTYDFTNALIIATSNAGSQMIQDGIQSGKSIDDITDMVKKQELPKFFKPELLNRFDAIVLFEQLSFKHVVEITQLLLDELAGRLMEKEILLEVTNESIQDIAHLGYEPSMGARPLRRVIQDRVEDSIAKLVLQKSVKPRDTIVLKKDFEIEVKKAKHYN